MTPPNVATTEEEQVESPPASPPNPPTNDLRVEMDALTRQTLSEQAGRIAELQRQLADRNATPVVSAPEDPAAFMTAPRQAIRDEMRVEIAAQIKPLVDFTNGLKRENEYNKLLKQMQIHAPALYTAYGPVAGYVDQIMATMEPTAENLRATILMAAGAVSLGLTGSTPPITTAAPVPPTPPKAIVTPPNLPSSPPPPPRKPTQGDEIDQKVAQLTETERKAARLSGFTDLRQYVEYRDADPDVSAWKDIK